MGMEEWQKDMEDKVTETHDMVKEIRDIVVGSENYKDGSLLHRILNAEKLLAELAQDRIERNASIKTTKVIMKFMWGVIISLTSALGALVVYLLKNFVK